MAPLRKTIGLCDLKPVTYFVVNVRYGNLCVSLELAACMDKIPQFMNNHVRQHNYIALPLALTLSVLCIFGKETQEVVNFPLSTRSAS